MRFIFVVINMNVYTRGDNEMSNVRRTCLLPCDKPLKKKKKRKKKGRDREKRQLKRRTETIS